MVEWKLDIADIEDLLPMISKVEELKKEEGVEGLVKLEEIDGRGVSEDQGEGEVLVMVKVEDA